ncbi:acyl-CoA reductase-like NAD-dependent aldehyde dehydrogenase [Bradyrhizobium sp. LM6.10]
MRFVGLTGSTEVGKILYRRACIGLKSSASSWAFRGVRRPDIDAAIEGAIVSKYRNMGQTCVCANRLYAEAGIYEEFVQKLSTNVAA